MTTLQTGKKIIYYNRLTITITTYHQVFHNKFWCNSGLCSTSWFLPRLDLVWQLKTVNSNMQQYFVAILFQIFVRKHFLECYSQYAIQFFIQNLGGIKGSKKFLIFIPIRFNNLMAMKTSNSNKCTIHIFKRRFRYRN